MPSPRRDRLSRLPLGLAVVHEDDAVIVVDKPSGLLTIATATERARTAYALLTDYVRGGNPRSRARVFIVHRLDRETSGLLVFARTETAKRRLQDGWAETRKQYFAVVHGAVSPAEGAISGYLAENAVGGVYEVTDPSRGKAARTDYRVVRRNRRFSLLEVDLLTGRKHQIRVHLAGTGHPVVGDRRYGPPDKTRKRLALHAAGLAFRHPVSGAELSFRSPLPPELSAIVPGARRG